MDSAFSLREQRVLIVGAAGGIGSATARVCASLGAELALVDRHAPEALAGELRSQGTRVQSIACDIVNRPEVEALVARLGEIHAAVVLAADCPWDDWNDDDWDQTFRRVIDVNLLGTIHVVRSCLPVMAAHRRGRIVLTGSVAARMGGVKASPHYVSAKGGIASLVKWLARKAAADGVLVNGIAPGITDTSMIAGQDLSTIGVPLNRKGAAIEIAWPIAFLCSEAASYICGAMLDVNGGLSMN
jgi:3-oxoacyl-[acyl-carrier protein] reductase